MTYTEATRKLRSLADEDGHPIMCDNDRCAIENTIVTDPVQRERLRRWVSALRSGVYPQGRFCMYDASTKGFCCLGVYCEAVDAVPAQYLAKLEYPNSTPNSTWPLLRSHNRAFAALNDSARLTFKETADIVEATLLRPIPAPQPPMGNGQSRRSTTVVANPE